LIAPSTVIAQIPTAPEPTPCDLVVAPSSFSAQLVAVAVVSLITAPISQSQNIIALAACEATP